MKENCPICNGTLAKEEFVLRPDNVLVKGVSCSDCLAFFEA